MFGKKSRPARTGYEAQRAARRAGRGMSAEIEGRGYAIVDISDSGVRLKGPVNPPRVTVIRVFDGRRVEREAPAVLVWERGGDCAYTFREKLGFCYVEQAGPRARGSSIRERLKS